jgi:hypothetical protein
LEYSETVNQLFIDLKKVYMLVRTEVLYSIRVWGTHEATQAD